MEPQQQWRSALVVAGVLIALSAEGCARRFHRPLQQPSPTAISQLWRSPDNLESRDLFRGPGGARLLPRASAYTFVAHKTGGTNQGYDVRDPGGRLWAVKLGDEAQSEVTVSRILWAIGFHQPPVYYVKQWRLIGAGAPDQAGARFRAELGGREVVGEWSWYDNPFLGSRPFSALVTVNVLLNNWDLKTANNKVYAVIDEDRRTQHQYVVRDLGASLGKARQPRMLTWFPFMRQMQGSKNNLEHFEAQGFVRAIEEDTVKFDYRGLDRALVNSVTAEDLRWTCALLSRLSQQQWLDAFRAGGYTAEESVRYVRKIRDKIRHARRLVEGASTTVEARRGA